MRRRVAVGASLGPLVLAALWLAVASAASAQSLTVTLATPGPFAPGTTVSVEIAGAEGDAWAEVRQCLGSDTSSGCLNGVGGATDTTGSARVDVMIRRNVVSHDGGKRGDCGLQACSLVVTVYGRSVETTSVPVTVEALPPTRPVVSVDPATDLVDLQSVSVSGTGFEPGAWVRLVQCTYTRCVRSSVSTSADAGGTLPPTTVVVRRVVDGLDCVANPCGIWAFPFDDFDHIGIAALAFDPAVPPAPPPVVEVVPSDGLRDGDVVAVTGSGFPAVGYVQIVQCHADLGQCRGFGFSPLDSAGGFATSFTVGRRVNIDDCVVVGCVLLVESEGGDRATVTLDFDPSVPPPPVPSLAVVPDSGLSDRQVVTVTVRDVPAQAYVSASLCLHGGGGCIWFSPGSPATAGEVVFDVALPRHIRGADCAPDACRLRVDVHASTATYTLDAGVGFDPALPVAPPPTLSVLPATGLWDGQRVQVEVDGVLPDEYLPIWQCVGPFDDPGSCVPLPGDQADLLGRLSLRLAVSQLLELGSTTADCRVVDCHLVAVSETGPLAAPLDFAPDTPPPGGFPGQLECVPWPTAGWPTGGVPEGIDPAALDEVIAQALAGGTRGIVVVHGGRIVAEGYDPGVDETTIQQSFSVSKTFVGTMIGSLVDDGLLDIDAPAPVPEWRDPADPRHGITTRHLLNMASGLEWDEDYALTRPTDILRMIATPDNASYVAEKPLESEPGTTFEYSTGTTQILARIISDVLDAHGDVLRAELDARLFAVLGQDERLQLDLTGVWRGGYLTNMTTRDFAKLGLLHLRGGVWEGSQLISREWIELMGTPSPANDGYGGQLWLQGGRRTLALGLNGQGIYIAPDLDLVVAVNSDTGSGGGNWQGVVELFESAAPPRCDAGPVLVDDVASTPPGRSVDIDVLGNDPGGGAGLRPDTLSIAAPPANGTAVVTDGRVTYTPSDGFTGEDAFDYLVCTTAPFCTTATVTIDVAPWDVRLTAFWPRVWPGWPAVIGVSVDGGGADSAQHPIAATVRERDCDTGASLGEPNAAEIATFPWFAHALVLWATEPEWRGCRELLLEFGDGSVHTVGIELIAPWWES